MAKFLPLVTAAAAISTSSTWGGATLPESDPRDSVDLGHLIWPSQHPSAPDAALEPLSAQNQALLDVMTERFRQHYQQDFCPDHHEYTLGGLGHALRLTQDSPQSQKFVTDAINQLPIDGLSQEQHEFVSGQIVSLFEIEPGFQDVPLVLTEFQSAMVLERLANVARLEGAIDLLFVAERVQGIAADGAHDFERFDLLSTEPNLRSRLVHALLWEQFAAEEFVALYQRLEPLLSKPLSDSRLETHRSALLGQLLDSCFFATNSLQGSSGACAPAAALNYWCSTSPWELFSFTADLLEHGRATLTNGGIVRLKLADSLDEMLHGRAHLDAVLQSSLKGYGNGDEVYCPASDRHLSGRGAGLRPFELEFLYASIKGESAYWLDMNRTLNAEALVALFDGMSPEAPALMRMTFENEEGDLRGHAALAVGFDGEDLLVLDTNFRRPLLRGSSQQVYEGNGSRVDHCELIRVPWKNLFALRAAFLVTASQDLPPNVVSLGLGIREQVAIERSSIPFDLVQWQRLFESPLYSEATSSRERASIIQVFGSSWITELSQLGQDRLLQLSAFDFRHLTSFDTDLSSPTSSAALTAFHSYLAGELSLKEAQQIQSLHIQLGSSHAFHLRAASRTVSTREAFEVAESLSPFAGLLQKLPRDTFFTLCLMYVENPNQRQELEAKFLNEDFINLPRQEQSYALARFRLEAN